MRQYGKVTYHILSNDTALVEMVGMDNAEKGPKIYPVNIPEGESFPGIAYTKSVEPRDVKRLPTAHKVTMGTIIVYAMHQDLDKCEDMIERCEEIMTVRGTQEVAGVLVKSLSWLGRDQEVYDATVDAYMIASRFYIMI